MNPPESLLVQRSEICDRNRHEYTWVRDSWFYEARDIEEPNAGVREWVRGEEEAEVRSGL